MGESDRLPHTHLHPGCNRGTRKGQIVMRRNAPMKRTAMRRKPRRRPTMTPDEYEAVMMRAQGRCEAAVAPDCAGVPQEWHHRQTRRHGGHQASNGAGICKACHMWVHAHPAEARDKGWIVSMHHPNPAEVPMLRRGKPVILHDDGSWMAVTVR